jgi:hypothetical protein
MPNSPQTVVALARTKDGRAAKIMLRIVDPAPPDLEDAKGNAADCFRRAYGDEPPTPTVWIEEPSRAPAPAVG